MPYVRMYNQNIDEWEILTNNPFKVGSDEWCDRSFINSKIITINFEIERNENTIKDYMEYINRDIEKGCFPNPRSEYIQEDIISYRKEVAKLKAELNVLTAEGPDKEKIERYWAIHNRGL